MINKECPDAYLKRKDIENRFQIKSSTVYDWVRNRGFPKAYRLSPRCARWLNSEVEQWEIQNRVKHKTGCSV